MHLEIGRGIRRGKDNSPTFFNTTTGEPIVPSDLIGESALPSAVRTVEEIVQRKVKLALDSRVTRRDANMTLVKALGGALVAAPVVALGVVKRDEIFSEGPETPVASFFPTSASPEVVPAVEPDHRFADLSPELQELNAKLQEMPFKAMYFGGSEVLIPADEAEKVKKQTKTDASELSFEIVNPGVELVPSPSIHVSNGGLETSENVSLYTGQDQRDYYRIPVLNTNDPREIAEGEGVRIEFSTVTDGVPQSRGFSLPIDSTEFPKPEEADPHIYGTGLISDIIGSSERVPFIPEDVSESILLKYLVDRASLFRRYGSGVDFVILNDNVATTQIADSDILLAARTPFDVVDRNSQAYVDFTFANVTRVINSILPENRVDNDGTAGTFFDTFVTRMQYIEEMQQSVSLVTGTDGSTRRRSGSGSIARIEDPNFLSILSLDEYPGKGEYKGISQHFTSPETAVSHVITVLSHFYDDFIERREGLSDARKQVTDILVGDVINMLLEKTPAIDLLVDLFPRMTAEDRKSFRDASKASGLVDFRESLSVFVTR